MHAQQIIAAPPHVRTGSNEALIRAMLGVCEAACRDAAGSIH